MCFAYNNFICSYMFDGEKCTFIWKKINTVVREKFMVGNIHQKKIGKFFCVSRLQTIINCYIYLW